MLVSPIPFDDERKLLVLLSFFNELMLLVHHVDSSLPKCFLSFDTNSKDETSLSVLHYRLFSCACLNSWPNVISDRAED